MPKSKQEQMGLLSMSAPGDSESTAASPRGSAGDDEPYGPNGAYIVIPVLTGVVLVSAIGFIVFVRRKAQRDAAGAFVEAQPVEMQMPLMLPEPSKPHEAARVTYELL